MISTYHAVYSLKQQMLGFVSLNPRIPGNPNMTSNAIAKIPNTIAATRYPAAGPSRHTDGIGVDNDLFAGV